MDDVVYQVRGPEPRPQIGRQTRSIAPVEYSKSLRIASDHTAQEGVIFGVGVRRHAMPSG
jgi:hypothetical protein